MFHLKATKFDIYDEISKVCPSQVNLKTASNQELITRINSMGQINSFPQNNPSPKSINEEDPDIETGENAMNIGFTFDQPSIKNFLDLE